MKLNHILFSAAACMALGSAALTSCSESFLDENQINAYDTDYFKTQEGINDLVNGAYLMLKTKFNYQWGYLVYCEGTDEFTDGNNTAAHYNHYGQSLNSGETTGIKPIWDNLYGTIEPANLIIANVPAFYNPQSPTYNARLGEGYFLRGYGYFELVKQFGGIPLKLTPSTGVETYFTRNSEEEVYAQIIADLEEAYKLLPEKPEQTGRITKSAAAHFLAKAHLFRASELYSSWNTQYVAADLDAVIKYGQEVVSAHPLCNDFVELWDYTAPNGANETVSEVVLAAQFSNDESTWGRYGNQMHLCFPSVYQDMNGTNRDISGGREFCYVSATQYTMDVFDRVNDSRFWKSFITTYGCNNTKGAPDWTEADIRSGKAPVGVSAGDKRFTGGELGIKYIVNNPGDTRYEDYEFGDKNVKVTKNNVIEAPHTFVRYFKGETHNWNTDISNLTGNWYQVIPHKRSVALSKYRDGSRNSIASQFGTRDAIIARSAEDVLMIAEAYIRKGESSYPQAIEWINKLRTRAGYAEGEDRSKHVDGGQSYKNNSYCTGKGGGYSAEGAVYWEINTYYESNNMEGQETTASTKSVMTLNSVEDVYNSQVDIPIYEKLGCGSNAEKMMCFLLNERTRELCGEMLRWEDLARTKSLNDRWHAFNDGVSRGLGEFNPQVHYYRPLPQSFLDGITNENGGTLTNEEKSAMQNPGY